MPIQWDRSRRIYIGNLDKPATKNEIRKLFERYGEIDKLWIAREPAGFAFLQYTNRINAVRAARALDGSHCCGCRIKVQLSIADNNHSTRRSRRVDHDIDSNQVPRRSSRVSTQRRSSPERCRSRVHRSMQRSQSGKSESCENTRQYLQCSICSENMLRRKPTITVCRHVFCFECIRTAIQRYSKCPICRRGNTETDLKQIYMDP